MPSSISSEVLILFIFLRVAILGLGISLPVRDSITFEASGPEILTTATPDTPGPLDNTKIVINSFDINFLENKRAIYCFYSRHKAPKHL